VAVLVPVNIYAEHVANRDGTLMRKVIYQLYLSQGWVDPPPKVGPGIEGDGYAFAKQLYGDPKELNESVVAAIRSNPDAFGRRLRLNASRFYGLLFDGGFFRIWQGAAALALLGLSVTSFVRNEERFVILFCAGMFAASHGLCAFLIDPRYVTICIPALLLLAAGGTARVMVWLGRSRRPFGLILVLAAAGLILWNARDHLTRLRNHLPPYERGVVAIRALAEHFSSVASANRPHVNREPHIELRFPSDSPVPPEEGFLMAYFTHSAWIGGEAEGPFPRGRFYAFRNIEPDFIYVPSESYLGPQMFPEMSLIGKHSNPIMGDFYLFQRTAR
jgi:hypothetical protein